MSESHKFSPKLYLAQSNIGGLVHKETTPKPSENCLFYYRYGASYACNFCSSQKAYPNPNPNVEHFSSSCKSLEFESIKAQLLPKSLSLLQKNYTLKSYSLRDSSANHRPHGWELMIGAIYTYFGFPLPLVNHNPLHLKWIYIQGSE